MGVYLAVTVFLILFYSALRRMRAPVEKKALVYSLTVAVVLALLLGLRHPSMGVDLGYGRSIGYLVSFSQLSAMSWKEIFALGSFQNYERGYILLNKLLGSISQREQCLLLGCGLLSLVPIGDAVGRYSANCRTSFLLCLGLPAFFICFSGLRQGIALGISFYAYRFVRERRFWPFLGTVLLACLFHSTAVVSLLVYPACRVLPDRAARWASLGVLSVLFAFRSEIWNAIVRITGRSIPAVHNGSVALMLLFCAIYVYMVLSSKGARQLEGLVNVQYLACCALIFAEVSNVAQRVGYYFVLYLMVSLPEVLGEIRKRRGVFEYSLHWLAVCGGFLLFGAYQLRTNTWAMAWPYRFFWEGIA